MVKPLIDQYLIEAIHTLPVRTFASLGFSTKVALTNDSYLDAKYTTDYLVRARVYSPDGTSFRQFDNLGTLAPKEKCILDIDTLTSERMRDQLVMFSLLPKRILDESADKTTCAIALDELRFLVNCQGHQIEYCRPDGYATGVLYAAGAFNYKKFHSERPTTLLQAPKAFISEDIDTLLTLVNSCPDSSYDEAHAFTCSVTSADGVPLCSHTEVLAPFTTKLISVGHLLSKSAPDVRLNQDKLDFFCISGFCSTGLLVPLVFTHNVRANTLAVEHTFGPWSYGTAVTGVRRRSADSTFMESFLFKPSKNG